MKVNQTITNQYTGETITLLVSENDNGGVVNKYQVFLPAHRPGPPLHYHTRFSETFTVTEGILDFYFDEYEHELSIVAGQSFTAQPRQLHRFENNHNSPVIFTVEAHPAGGLVKAFQLAYGVANAGGARKDGLPRNMITRLYFIKLSQGYLPGIPLFIQKTVFGIATFLLAITGQKSKLDKHFA